LASAYIQLLHDLQLYPVCITVALKRLLQVTFDRKSEKKIASDRTKLHQKSLVPCANTMVEFFPLPYTYLTLKLISQRDNKNVCSEIVFYFSLLLLTVLIQKNVKKQYLIALTSYEKLKKIRGLNPLVNCIF
jgi:hypothetical protein